VTADVKEMGLGTAAQPTYDYEESPLWVLPDPITVRLKLGLLEDAAAQAAQRNTDDQVANSLRTVEREKVRELVSEFVASASSAGLRPSVSNGYYGPRHLGWRFHVSYGNPNKQAEVVIITVANDLLWENPPAEQFKGSFLRNSPAGVSLLDDPALLNLALFATDSFRNGLRAAMVSQLQR
jgi:hypothetical protein